MLVDDIVQLTLRASCLVECGQKSAQGHAVVTKKLNRRVGASTGTHVIGALALAERMQPQQTGSIVTLICDSGERYLDTYYNDVSVAQHIGSIDEMQH